MSRGVGTARFRRRAAVSDTPRPGDAVVFASAARRPMNAWISSARQTVVPGPSLKGCGALPALTQAHHVVALTGIGPGIPRRGSPSSCACLTNPVSGSVLTRYTWIMDFTVHLDGYERLRWCDPEFRARGNRNGDSPVLLLAFLSVGGFWRSSHLRPPRGVARVRVRRSLVPERFGESASARSKALSQGGGPFIVGGAAE